MINKITVRSFKSLQQLDIELGRVNVLIGANGSGKSNFLEAIGVLSAAADGKITDQTLMQRGVRPGVPKLYKSAFPSTDRALSHISFGGASGPIRYDVTLHNPLRDPSPAWRFKTENFTGEAGKIASRGIKNSKSGPNTENGLIALRVVELEEDNPALKWIRVLQRYVIFSPNTPVLRGVALETQPAQPLGLSGGRLPEAVQELLLSRADEKVRKVYMDALRLIGWAKSYGSRSADALPLSPAASVSSKVIRFVDRYMAEGKNVLSGYDASEGALYVLFMAVLASHPRAPSFFAIDNADHGLNPGLAKSLMSKFTEWILDRDDDRQVIITSHNPSVLDGLPIQDDRVRLFTMDRDNGGRSIVKRIMPTENLLNKAANGWTLSRMWTNKLIGGMPDV